MSKFLGFVPDWSAPVNVRSFITERKNGSSLPPFLSNNLASHVGDDIDQVQQNREALKEHLGLTEPPFWLSQIHSNKVVVAGQEKMPEADACYSQTPGKICAVLTADCLPLLLCDKSGAEIAAVHCGWRGLEADIISRTLECFTAASDQILAYLGPAIGPENYEVGEDVVSAFASILPNKDLYAVANQQNPGHYFLDLYALARLQLQLNGVAKVFGGECCTYKESDRFYSYRREGTTGRMASLIWLE